MATQAIHAGKTTRSPVALDRKVHPFASMIFIAVLWAFAVGRVTCGRACFAVRADCQKIISRPRARVRTNCDRFSRARVEHYRVCQQRLWVAEPYLRH